MADKSVRKDLHRAIARVQDPSEDEIFGANAGATIGTLAGVTLGVYLAGRKANRAGAFKRLAAGEELSDKDLSLLDSADRRVVRYGMSGGIPGAVVGGGIGSAIGRAHNNRKMKKGN